MKFSPFTPPDQPRRATKGEHLGDGEVYLYWDTKVVLAINVALATERPLLVRGRPGTGKSTLARNLSVELGRDFESVVVTSRTTTTDLLWELDHVERLARAQVGGDVHDLAAFVRPGPFWRAFTHRRANILDAQLPANPADQGAVLLIDEIDKADPDLPNALLEPMESRRFGVGPLAREVRCERPTPLVVFTTNGYRPLARPFLRRCIEITLGFPDLEQLTTIASHHFGGEDEELYRGIAMHVVRQPELGSVAEYLDVVRACMELDVRPGSPRFDWLMEVALRKPGGRR